MSSIFEDLEIKRLTEKLAGCEEKAKYTLHLSYRAEQENNALKKELRGVRDKNLNLIELNRRLSAQNFELQTALNEHGEVLGKVATMIHKSGLLP